MKDRLQSELDRALRRVLGAAGDRGEPPEYVLERPRRAEHGDFACNAALLLARRLRKPPRAIAEELVAALREGSGIVERAEVAGPGFVNLWLADDRWHDVLRAILAAGPAFGRADHGKRTRVQVEFVSANPTGPLSVGHGRQAVLGDCIARLLEACEYDVTREYYFNNGGRQMRVLGQSVKARYLELLGRAAPPPPEAFVAGADWPEAVDGLPVAFPRDGYQGDYVREIADVLRAEHGDGLVDEPADGLFRETAEAVIFKDIRDTLDALGIRFDVYYNESSLYEEGRLEEVLSALRGQGLVYEHEGATWLRATTLGLERDRVLVKGTGEPTYLLPDIAYHREKFRRGFDRVIDVMGADHIEQFPYVRAAVGALGCDPERVQLVMNQFVTLSSGGQKVKQSTRKATFITSDELLADVGADVFRFFMIERKADGHLDFDLDLARERNWRKNPTFYVQYAHARTCGVLAKAAEAGIAEPAPEGFDASRLSLPEELEIVRALLRFPELVATAAESREPHHLAYYLREVAGLWNPYLQDGKRHRVVSDDAELSAARLALCAAVRQVLASGLGVLGLTAPERM